MTGSEEASHSRADINALCDAKPDRLKTEALGLYQTEFGHSTVSQPLGFDMVRRREQMVDDGVMLSLDQDHWNGARPQNEQINLPLDVTQNVKWRKNGLDDEDEAA